MWKNGDRFTSILENYSRFKIKDKKGTIIDDEDQDSLVVCFDDNVNGWGDSDLNIPDGHGIYIDSDNIIKV